LDGSVARLWIDEEQLHTIRIEENCPASYLDEFFLAATWGVGALEYVLSERLGALKEKTEAQSGQGEATEVARDAANPEEPVEVEHYLYFPDRAKARLALPEIRKRGYNTQDRRSADGGNWLVLARKSADEVDDIDDGHAKELEAIARNYQGEYDGWEAKTGQS
jgi:regulator of RNase E activity RraB